MKRFGLRGVGVLVVAGALAATLAQASYAAPWCGSPSVQDRAPAVAGRTIRVVYVIPSDGADRTGELAPRISADVDEIAAWWRTQDGEREPRFDRAAFPCGPQADIVTLRLTGSAAALAPGNTRFERIANAIQAPTGYSGYEKHLVYYDGPTDNDRICGQGGGTADAAGIAIVYLSACSGVPTASVAAHELLHAFGALAASGPPNACPDTRGHPCDSDTDLLYPFADTTPLGSLILDFGRNDYYGHAGGWLDVQDSPWLRLVTRQVPLTVGIAGPGPSRATSPESSARRPVRPSGTPARRSRSRRSPARDSVSCAGRARARAYSGARSPSRRLPPSACCSPPRGSGSSSRSRDAARSPVPERRASLRGARARRRRTRRSASGRRRRRAGASPGGAARAAGAARPAPCR